MLGIIFVGLATMVGCQGFSSGKAATQQGTTQSGTLTLGVASLNFGSVTTGTTKTMTLTASNTGTATVTVSGASFSTQYFSMSAPSLPTTIVAGQSTPLTLVFAPNAAGAFNATVTISSDASDASGTVSLTGTGVASGLLAESPTSESFGSVTVGTQSSQTVTLTNNSNASITISQAAVSGTGFTLSGITTPLAIAAAQSTTFTVKFAPQTTGSASGTVTITSNGPNPSLTLPLTGTGSALGALGPSPASLNFGTVQTGTSQPLSETVTNTGGSALTISKVAITGTGFTLSAITTPVTLTPGQTSTFTVTFAPTSTASASGSVTVTSNGSNPSLVISLTGAGSAVSGTLGVSPTPVAIGNVFTGTSGTAVGSLSATGANVTITAASSSSGLFTISGLSLPKLIAAGTSVPFTVTYSPTVASAGDTSTLTFTSNALVTSTTDTATGSATAAPVHTVTLTWDASVSTDISGYNVYRAVYNGSCGSYSKINGATLVTLLTYVDSKVTDGTNYCYATTAVDSSNVESGYSNVVSDVQIPPP